MGRLSAIGLLVVCIPSASLADDAAVAEPADVRSAVERGLRILQTGARNYPRHRKCFSCHHQTLPLLAMRAAQEAGIAIDAKLFTAQVEFTRQSLEGRIESLRAGTGIGGRAMTVGYALWTHEIAGADKDELSDAMVTYLLGQQEENGAWRPPSNRPPLEESSLMCTVLALYGLDRYARDEHRGRVQPARESALAWIRSARPQSQEDYNAKLWSLALFGGQPEERERARRDVLTAQRDDGGWSQLPDMASDPYATGQTLFLLAESGLPTTASEYRKGVRFLLNAQKEDGSWHVPTRSKPVQVYFDNGDPHGKDQFISMAATAWAVAALSQADAPPAATSDDPRDSK